MTTNRAAVAALNGSAIHGPSAAEGSIGVSAYRGPRSGSRPGSFPTRAQSGSARVVICGVFSSTPPSRLGRCNGTRGAVLGPDGRAGPAAGKIPARRLPARKPVAKLRLPLTDRPADLARRTGPKWSFPGRRPIRRKPTPAPGLDSRGLPMPGRLLLTLPARPPADGPERPGLDRPAPAGPRLAKDEEELDEEEEEDDEDDDDLDDDDLDDDDLDDDDLDDDDLDDLDDEEFDDDFD